MGSQPLQEAGGEHSLQVSDHGIVKAETLEEDVLGSVSKGHLEPQLQTACHNWGTVDTWVSMGVSKMTCSFFIWLFMIFR